MTNKPRLVCATALRAFCALTFALFAAISGVHAQTYITPVTVQAQIFNTIGTAQVSPNTNTTTPCTPSAGQRCAIPNLGQVYHQLTYTVAGSPRYLQIQLEGSEDGTTFFTISDVGTSVTGGSIWAIGSWPVIRLNLVSIDTGGGISISAFYNGTSTVSGSPTGNYNPAQQLRTVLLTGNTSTTSASIGNPFGSTGGYIALVTVAGAPIPSGSTLVVATDFGVTTHNVVSYNLSTSGYQVLYVPPYPATTISIGITYGSASSAVLNAYYFFLSPGQNAPSLYSHITGTTATNVNGVSSTLLGITVNTAAAGTVSVFDLAPAACTGTPVTNIAAVITVGATDVAHTIPYNLSLQNGLCMKASVAMDLTVTYQ